MLSLSLDFKTGITEFDRPSPICLKSDSSRLSIYPSFCWQNKIPLSKSKFMNNVRLELLRANLPADIYAGHSFQIGAATTAASAGIEDSTIQTLGRWQSSSYLLYIRLDPCHMASLSSTLAKCSS